MNLVARLTRLSLIIFSPICVVAQTVPEHLTITNTANTAVTLQWDTLSGATLYRIYYSTSETLTPKNTATFKTVSVGTAEVDGLTANTKYYFIITATEGGVESEPSTPVFTTTTDGVEATPVLNTASPSENGGTPTTNVSSTPSVQSQDLDPGLVALIATPKGLSKTTGVFGYDKENVESLVSGACANRFVNFSKEFSHGTTYAVINILNLEGDPASQVVGSNNWYVYSRNKDVWGGFIGGWKASDFNGATRLYGASRVYLVSLLLNDRSSGGHAPSLGYKVTITKQQATNVADVMALLSLVAPSAGLAPTTNDWIGCDVVNVDKTSTIKIDTSYNEDGVTPLQASQTFTNEGKSHWDVSFALPIKKASALQYSTTANTVTAAQINKSDLFAVADLYPIPVDLSATNASLAPGLFFGVAMNSQPLHSFIVGASVGIHLAQIYVGALLIKQQELNGLSPGNTASPGQVSGASSYGYEPQFTVGIKISIRAAASALAKAKQ